MTRTGIVRRTSGLSESHKELVRLLAEIVVQDYLRETDAANTMDEHDRKE